MHWLSNVCIYLFSLLLKFNITFEIRLSHGNFHPILVSLLFLSLSSLSPEHSILNPSKSTISLLSSLSPSLFSCSFHHSFFYHSFTSLTCFIPKLDPELSFWSCFDQKLRKFRNSTFNKYKNFLPNSSAQKIINSRKRTGLIPIPGAILRCVFKKPETKST